MSKKMKFAFVIAIALSFIIGAIANANGGLTRLTEVYLNNDITILLNGTLFNATDPQDGSVYVPLTYKGRTYLPLRAIAEAVGIPVDYDKRLKFKVYFAWDEKELETGYGSEDKPLKLHIANEYGMVIKKIEDIKQGTEMEFDID